MQTKKLIMRFILALTTLTMLCFRNAAHSETPQEVYTFLIGPTQSATELAKNWTPVMQYLTEKSGISLQFKTSKDIPTFHQQMQEGIYDFAYISPYYYLVSHKSVGYTAFAREKNGKLLGILVVKKGGAIQNVGQLNGKTVAFPAANAIAATWLPMHMLQQNNATVTPQYVNSMESVYRSVAKGLFPAGGGTMQTLTALDSKVRDQLQVLWTSEPLPPFTFAVHPRIPKDVVAKLQSAMVEMDTNPQGYALLKAINFKGVELTNDAAYDTMRKMNIKPVDAK